MIEIIKNISAVIGCIMSFLALCGVVIKPIRNVIINWIRHVAIGRESEVAIANINQILEGLGDKIDALSNKVDKIDARVTENEVSRIKDNIFNYGSRCRKGEMLSEYEYTHLCDIYHKYHDVLHANGSGQLEFEFIVGYYNRNANKNNN